MTAIPNRQKFDILTLRHKHLNPALSVAYQEPLKIVRGEDVWLYDENDTAYLDMVNNVCHVGHCHPRVVAAGQEQMARLNTNTRYLHDNIIEYALRLTATLPDPLSVVFLTNSGTEANDLALRLAQTYTNATGKIVIDHAYHGHSPSMVDLSPYKFNGSGGEGQKPHVAITSMPDIYQGEYRDPRTAGAQYGEKLPDAIAQLRENNTDPAIFYAESMLGCGGQIPLPENYLKTAYEAIHAVGGLCLADEVQVGFGRDGDHFWAFENQGVIPDILTFGKPVANGHPMAGVVTSPDIARKFVTGMEYFNTFGGNPVSCAIGMAVLDVIEDQNLQENARQTGQFLRDELNHLATRHPAIGDVRGRGLFIGAELVHDPDTRAPNAKLANAVVETMKAKHVLLSTEGPNHNVLKIKPPIVFTQHHGEEFLDKLDQTLTELGA